MVFVFPMRYHQNIQWLHGLDWILLFNIIKVGDIVDSVVGRQFPCISQKYGYLSSDTYTDVALLLLRVYFVVCRVTIHIYIESFHLGIYCVERPNVNHDLWFDYLEYHHH
jgi:hypothetical protein